MTNGGADGTAASPGVGPGNMEDARTKAALDALADLFLTGTAPAAPLASSKQVSTGTSDPVTRGEASISGPRPIRLSPKLRAVQHQNAIHVDPIPSANEAPIRDSELPTAASRVGPQLRLHRTEVSTAAASPVSTPAPSDSQPPLDESQPIALHVEVAFLGNLPGFGGPWLTQYARHLAQRHGPVGVLHVDDERIDLDLVTAGRPPLPQDITDPVANAEHALEAWTDQVSRSSLPALIDAMIHRAPVAVATWLIHLPTHLTEMTQTLAQQVKRWTLVCGADEIAVAAGQRLFRSLLENDPARDQRRLASMIVGADEARSFQAADRLRAYASAAGLGMIELVGWQKQMVPVELTSLASFADPQGAWARLWPTFKDHAGIDETLPPAESLTETEPSDQKPQPKLADHAESPDQSAAVKREQPARDAAEPAKAQVSRRLADELLEEEDDESDDQQEDRAAEPVAPKLPRRKVQPTEQVKPSRAPRAAEEPSAPAAAEPELASFVSGLVALQARSPRHAATQLALDEDGVIHLLLRHESPRRPSLTDAADSLRAAVLELIETRAWVKEHHVLLAMTQRQMRFDDRTEPVLHLFTDDAKLATALVTRLGQYVRFHLLKRVALGESSTWFSTEMN
ncbi:MAG: hypothetical protein IT444_13570 [Phycisphaeraceae bacterium]|nr:hypothetical protein [Phycisphaeraceae bacterium]